jgi:hypothetical protein
VNAIKCELGETFADERFSDLVGTNEANNRDVTATLELGEVFTLKNSGSAGAGFEIPLGIEIDASGSRARSTTRGESFKLSFDYNLEDETSVPEFCAALGSEIQVEGDPFADLLLAVGQEYIEIEAGEPKVQLRSVQYNTNFAVETTTTTGGKIKFLVFSLGAEKSRTIRSNQTLSLSFNLSETVPKLNQLILVPAP